MLILLAFVYGHVHKTHAIYDRMIENDQYVMMDVSQDQISQKFVCEGGDTGWNPGEMPEFAGRSRNRDPDLSSGLRKWRNGCGICEKRQEISKRANSMNFRLIRSAMQGKAYKVVFEKDSIALYAEKTSEEGTNLKINSEESEGTLILKTVTYRFDIETFCVFLSLVLYICVFFQFLNWLFSR